MQSSETYFAIAFQGKIVCQAGEIRLAVHRRSRQGASGTRSMKRNVLLHAILHLGDAQEGDDDVPTAARGAADRLCAFTFGQFERQWLAIDVVHFRQRLRCSEICTTRAICILMATQLLRWLTC